MRFVLAVITVMLTTAAATGCAGEVDGDASNRQPSGAEAWRQLPQAPLTPRDHAVVVGVDERMLVVGGWEFLCPPNADCSTPGAPLLRDGAVYDRETDSWTRITPAPFGVRRQDYATAAVDGSAYLVSGCADGPRCTAQPRLLSYSLTADGWTDHGPIPGTKRTYRHLIPVGGNLLVYSGSDERGEVGDQVYDPERSTWTAVPNDPLPRSFDRFIVPVGDHLVLAGSPIAALGGEDSTKLAARFDLRTRQWTQLANAPGQGFQLLPTDRGLLLNGHFGDFPGWILDAEMWTWSALPEHSDEHTDLGGVLNRDRAIYDISSSVGQLASANRLRLYDSRANAFVSVPAPPGREEVYDDSSTALGHDLFVYGGQRWHGDGSTGDGELVGDSWLWTAPVD